MRWKKTFKALSYFIPAFLILVLIFGFSSQNGAESGSLSDKIYYLLVGIIHYPWNKGTVTFLIRKCAHMTEFGCLALALYYGFSKNGFGHLFTRSLLWTFGFAALDEIHQLFIPGRAGQTRDVLIDTCGALIFLGLLKLMQSRVENKDI